jgi:hypothetical protein
MCNDSARLITTPRCFLSLWSRCLCVYFLHSGLKAKCYQEPFSFARVIDLSEFSGFGYRIVPIGPAFCRVSE